MSDPPPAELPALKWSNPMVSPPAASITHPAERDRASLLERGRLLRASTPRADQGNWEPAPDRDPVAVLERQAETRLSDLVAVRHGRMLSSPFAFFRGGPAIMASDLSTTPRTGVAVQACGDAHLLNFGLYATPERHLVFDLNDFDETLPAPWEWDVKRLATSLVVAGRSIGAGTGQTEAMVYTAVGGYCETLRALADLATLDLWYARPTSRAVRGSSRPSRRSAPRPVRSRRRDPGRPSRPSTR